MCLAIPAKVTEIGSDNLATVDILGATREVSLDLTPSAKIGSYVLVHAGFAIEVVDEQFAQETIDLIREFPDLISEEIDGANYSEDASEEASENTSSSENNDGNLSVQQVLWQVAKEL